MLEAVPCIKWFKWTACTQTVEAAYILAQEHLLEGLSALKEDCRTTARQQEVLIHSDMDQIVESRRQLEEKVRGNVLNLLQLDTFGGGLILGAVKHEIPL